MVVQRKIKHSQEFHRIAGSLVGSHLFLLNGYQAGLILFVDIHPRKEIKQDAEAYHGVAPVLNNLVELHFMPQLILTNLPLMYKPTAVNKYRDVFIQCEHLSDLVFQSG